MLIKKKKEWKKYLSPRDEERLNNILVDVSKHRGAYRNSEDIKTAQLWSAVLELRKENALLYKKVKRLEDVLDVVSKRLDSEKERKRELIDSLEGF